MTKAQYDNIMSCVRRKGTKSQRADARALRECVGYDISCADIYKLRDEVRHLKTVSEGYERLWLRERAKQSLTEEYTELVLRLGRTEEVLEELCDIQNGPPLVRYEEEWNDIMKRAREILED